MQTVKLTLAVATCALAVAGAAQAGDLGAASTQPAVAPALARVKGYTIATSGSSAARPGCRCTARPTAPRAPSSSAAARGVTSSSTAASINSSYPTATGWAADVNNASGSATTFAVYAVCAKQPRRYQRLTGVAFTVQAFSQNGTAWPAAKAAPLGGGGYSDSGALTANLNSSLPANLAGGSTPTTRPATTRTPR